MIVNNHYLAQKNVESCGVPPFGNLFDLEVIGGEALYQNEKIVFNAGRTTSITTKSADYKKIVQPIVGRII